jgi:Fur family ferric uptake transcriptional regulator
MQTIRTDATQVLSTHALEATPARISILRICMNSDKPIDVNFVAGKMGSKAHLATVYRTLEKFVSAGILERIDFQEGKFRYEFMHDHHHHAVCNSCGKVEDISDTTSEIEALENRLSKQSGFSVTKHVLELFGLCKKCQRSK